MFRACVALSQNGVGHAQGVSLVSILACVWRRNRFCVIHEIRRVGKVSGERSDVGEVVRCVCCGIFFVTQTQPPPSCGEDAPATPSLRVKSPAGREMFIAEYGESCVFGPVPFFVETVSESWTNSGMEPDLKGYSSLLIEGFEALLPEKCFKVSPSAFQRVLPMSSESNFLVLFRGQDFVVLHEFSFLADAEAAAAVSTGDAFPHFPFPSVATAAFLYGTTLDGKAEGKRIRKALCLLVCCLCAPQVTCTGHTAAACLYMALHSECLAAAALAGALLIYGLFVVSFGRPLVILQAFDVAMIGRVWIMSAVGPVLFGSGLFCGFGTQVVDSLVAAGRRLVLGLRREEVSHSASLALCDRPWPPRRCGHVLRLRFGGSAWCFAGTVRSFLLAPPACGFHDAWVCGALRGTTETSLCLSGRGVTTGGRG